MIPELGSMNITKGISKNIYKCETTGQLIQLYHKTMGYPCKFTWCKAITAGYFKGQPGLTAACVCLFIKAAEETEMGHMDQQRQGTCSTKTVPIKPGTTEEVPQLTNNYFSHHVYTKTTNLEDKLYSDQTGRFPITSNRGSFYVAIFYAVDGNCIRAP